MAITRIQKGELEQLVDAALGYQSDEVTRKTITMVAEVAFRCLQSDADMRPPIKEVLEVLQAIESDGYRPEKKEHGDAESRDDAELLKNTEPFSPDSIMNSRKLRSTLGSLELLELCEVSLWVSQPWPDFYVAVFS
ncbi:STYKc [Musa troglodytarum]|uniref:STYKc n=1 Tax=Musa troglodytarum TaxID=320322 RepID=A0A9E7EAV9_9LILI|nr:STYKc [Musa troglodytarum]